MSNDIDDEQRQPREFADPSGLVKLPADSVLVEDAEEEVFLLYTRLSTRGPEDGSHAFAGLGFVDSKHDELLITFDLPHPSLSSTKEKPISPNSKRHRKRQPQKPQTAESISLEIKLAQDQSALRSKKGDTGSVVWRVSVSLCELLLHQLCSNHPAALFNRDELKGCTVLELGAGTGLLGIVLSPWVHQYIATDLDYLAHLIRKNITLNISNITRELERSSGLILSSNNTTVEALDWLQLHQAPAPSRRNLFRLASPPAANIDVESTHPRPSPDIIFAVDCIFNPALIPPLVDTINHFAVCGHTKVVVAVELRSEDVIRDFLELWLGKGDWEVWRVGDYPVGEGKLDVSYVMWIGMKVM